LFKNEAMVRKYVSDKKEEEFTGLVVVANVRL